MEGIYILTNTLTGDEYVGKDSNLPRRPNEHLSLNSPQCPAIHRAIKKYGRDAFKLTIIKYPDFSDELLNHMEKFWIRKRDSFHNGYNCTEGGEGLRGRKCSAETKQKIADAHIGKTLSDEHKRKLSAAKKGKPSPKKGKPLSKEAKRKIAETKLGMPQLAFHIRVNLCIRAGWSQSKIARVFGYSHHTIRKYLKIENVVAN